MGAARLKTHVFNGHGFYRHFSDISVQELRDLESWDFLEKVFPFHRLLLPYQCCRIGFVCVAAPVVQENTAVNLVPPQCWCKWWQGCGDVMFGLRHNQWGPKDGCGSAHKNITARYNKACIFLKKKKKFEKWILNIFCSGLHWNIHLFRSALRMCGSRSALFWFFSGVEKWCYAMLDHFWKFRESWTFIYVWQK